MDRLPKVIFKNTIRIKAVDFFKHSLQKVARIALKTIKPDRSTENRGCYTSLLPEKVNIFKR